MFRLFFFILFLFAISGCVGTVEEATSANTETAPPDSNNIQFAGVTSVVPISDTKLEIKFDRAQGGSGKFVYEIYVGELPPIYVPSETFDPLETKLKYTATNLTLGTKYSVRVEVRDADFTDPKVAPRSNNQRYEFGTTFSNEVCDFRGISDVQNMPGEDGKTSLKIKWAPAGISTGPTADGYPKSYEIILLAQGLASSSGTGNSLSDESFNDETKTPQDGRYTFSVNHSDGINQFTARGLASNYRYKIRVRCLHRLSATSPFNPRLYSELNTSTLIASTLDQTIEFDPSTINLSLLQGTAGLTGAEARWGSITGAFNHIRIYSRITDVTEPPTISPTCERSDGCEKFDYTRRSGMITGLTPNTSYKFFFYVCKNQNCTDYQSYSESERPSLTTNPALLDPRGNGFFSLIYDTDEVGAIKLDVGLPDFSQGLIDGYQIKYKKNGGEWTESSADNSIIEVDPYNVFIDNKITVRVKEVGGDSDIYQFQVFTSQGSTPSTSFSLFGPVDLTSKPESLLKGPKANEFSGISNISFNGTQHITISWDKPTAGFYSHYDFYVESCSLPCTGNPIVVTNSPTLSINRNEVSCDDEDGTCMETFSVDPAQVIRIGLTTSFISPLVTDGILPRISNDWYWTCAPEPPSSYSCSKNGP